MNPKLLRDLILQGHRVAVKTKDGLWKVFLFIKGNGNFEGTLTRQTIEEYLKAGLSSISCTKQEIQDNFTNEYKIVTPAPLILQPGDKVEILENVREYAEENGWTKECIDMIGQKWLEIEDVDYSLYRVYTKDKSNRYSFPHRAVAKCEGTEETTAEQEAIELLRKNGYKIVKE